MNRYNKIFQDLQNKLQLKENELQFSKTGSLEYQVIKLNIEKLKDEFQKYKKILFC